MVWLRDLKITRVRWPDATAEQQARFTQYVETDFPASGFRMTIARLQASLASAEAERSHTEGLKNDAPKIVFSEQLAVLLLYDGEPRLQAIDSTPLALVVNTPFGVVKDTTTGIYWLTDGTTWYSATDPKGPWHAPATPPDIVSKLQSAETTLAQADTAPATAPVASSPQYVNTLSHFVWPINYSARFRANARGYCGRPCGHHDQRRHAVRAAPSHRYGDRTDRAGGDPGSSHMEDHGRRQAAVRREHGDALDPRNRREGQLPPDFRPLVQRRVTPGAMDVRASGFAPGVVPGDSARVAHRWRAELDRAHC